MGAIFGEFWLEKLAFAFRVDNRRSVFKPECVPCPAIFNALLLRPFPRQARQALYIAYTRQIALFLQCDGGIIGSSGTRLLSLDGGEVTSWPVLERAHRL